VFINDVSKPSGTSQWHCSTSGLLDAISSAAQGLNQGDHPRLNREITALNTYECEQIAIAKVELGRKTSR
jgi:hypothetical protein